MTGVVVNGKLYYLYIFIMLHYNSALLLTVDLIYIYLSPSTLCTLTYFIDESHVTM